MINGDSIDHGEINARSLTYHSEQYSMFKGEFKCETWKELLDLLYRRHIENAKKSY